MQYVFGIIPWPQQLVKRTSINGEMASLYIAFHSYVVHSHTKPEHSFTHSIELMYGIHAAINFMPLYI